MGPTARSQSIAAQAADLSPSDFREWAAKKVDAIDKLIGAVTEQVQSDNIETVAGARIASCITGSVFGYEEFHPRQGALPAEQMLDAELLGTVGQRHREPVGSR